MTFFIHGHFLPIDFDAACGDFIIILNVFINICRWFTHSCPAIFPKHTHFPSNTYLGSLCAVHNLKLIC